MPEMQSANGIELARSDGGRGHFRLLGMSNLGKGGQTEQFLSFNTNRPSRKQLTLTRFLKRRRRLGHHGGYDALHLLAQATVAASASSHRSSKETPARQGDA